MKVIILFLLILLLFYILYKKCKEDFIGNFISVYDGKNFHYRFRDFLDGSNPNRIIIYDKFGFPHLLDNYSDLKFITPNNFRYFKGHVWNLPHDRKVIRV